MLKQSGHITNPFWNLSCFLRWETSMMHLRLCKPVSLYCSMCILFQKMLISVALYPEQWAQSKGQRPGYILGWIWASLDLGTPDWGTRMQIRSLVRRWIKSKQNGPHVFEVQQWWWRAFTLGVVLGSVTWGPLSFLRFIWGSRKIHGFDSGQGAEGVPQKQMSCPFGDFLELEEQGCIDQRVPSSEPPYLKVLCPPTRLASVGPALHGLQKHNAWVASHRWHRRAYFVVLFPSSALFPLFLSSFPSVEIPSSLEPLPVFPVPVLRCFSSLLRCKILNYS